MALDPRMLAATPAELARKTVEVALRRPDYEELRQFTQTAFDDLATRTDEAKQSLLETIPILQHTVLYDLTGLDIDRASCALLGWGAAFHVLKDHARQFLVLPVELREALANATPRGVFAIGEGEAETLAANVWRWFTITGDLTTRLAADPASTWTDSLWAAALDDADEPTSLFDSNEASLSSDVIWNPIARLVVETAMACPAVRHPRPSMSVLVVNSRQRDCLAPSLKKLFANTEVASIESFVGFYELAMRIAAGRVKGIAIADASRPARARIIRDLCAAMGIRFSGPSLKGVEILSEASPDANELKNTLRRRFGEQWLDRGRAIPAIARQDA
jgi:hypothetical protein